MGIAVHRSFLTYAASVVQVHINDAGKLQITRVDSALDAGTVVNPEMARSQFEGAAVMGTGVAPDGRITATDRAGGQSDLDTLRLARVTNDPRGVLLHMVASGR